MILERVERLGPQRRSSRVSPHSRELLLSEFRGNFVFQSRRFRVLWVCLLGESPNSFRVKWRDVITQFSVLHRISPCSRSYCALTKAQVERGSQGGHLTALAAILETR
jgi:hypothetical protein